MQKDTHSGIRTFDKLNKLVKENNNVLTVKRQVLLDCLTSSKLDSISNILKSYNLIDYSPLTYSEDNIRIYRRGTRIANLIRTVLNPSIINDQKLLKYISDSVFMKELIRY